MNDLKQLQLLSTEELEDILYKSINDDPRNETDVDTIDAICKILVDRDNISKEEREAEAEAAWHRFLEYYKLRSSEE